MKEVEFVSADRLADFVRHAACTVLADYMLKARFGMCTSEEASTRVATAMAAMSMLCARVGKELGHPFHVEIVPPGCSNSITLGDDLDEAGGFDSGTDDGEPDWSDGDEF